MMRLPGLPWRRCVLPTTVGLTLALTGVALAAGLGVSADKLTVTTVAGGIAPRTCTLTEPMADAFVDASAPDANSGAGSTLDVRSGANARRVFVRFDLSRCSIPAGSSIRSAELGMTLATAPEQSRFVQLHRVVEGWSEGALTWSNQPPVATAATAEEATGTTGGAAVRWGVTADVQAVVDGTATDSGWRLRDRDENGGADALTQLASREHATTSARPALTISYHP